MLVGFSRFISVSGEKQRLSSGHANAQAVVSLCCLHKSFFLRVAVNFIIIHFIVPYCIPLSGKNRKKEIYYIMIC